MVTRKVNYSKNCTIQIFGIQLEVFNEYSIKKLKREKIDFYRVKWFFYMEYN